MSSLAILLLVIFAGSAAYKIAEALARRIGDRGNVNPSETAREFAHLHDRLDRMEQRLENLETIVVERRKEEKFAVLNDKN